jgi:hypothetical protein
MRSTLVIFLSLGFLCIFPTTTHAASRSGDHFEDAWSFFGRAGQAAVMSVNDYDAAVRALGAQFDAICGDTFCEGDYSNLTSLGIECSVAVATEKVGDCVWTFAGSATTVDEDTGALSISKDVFACHLGLDGTATDLATFLATASKSGASGYEGLRSATIPGQRGQTLMDVLQTCL